MKEIVYDQNGKKGVFSTYYIINNNFISSTKNFNIESHFEDCFYIKKLGSNVHPRIYFNEKKNNKWIRNNVFIGDYYSFMDFIANNKASIICIRGFSRAVMGEFMLALNKLKNMNIRPIKFVSDIERVQYEKHLITKKERMKKLHQKLEKNSEIETGEDYMKIANSVFGEKRHKARQRVLKKKNKF